MRKIISISIIISLCIFLASCGGNENETGEAVVEDPSETQEYYIPEPEGGPSTEDFELGGVPLE